MEYGAIHTKVGQEEHLADLMKKYIAFYPDVPKSEDIVITPAYSTLWRNRNEVHTLFPHKFIPGYLFTGIPDEVAVRDFRLEELIPPFSTVPYKILKRDTGEKKEPFNEWRLEGGDREFVKTIIGCEGTIPVLKAEITPPEQGGWVTIVDGFFEGVGGRVLKADKRRRQVYVEMDFNKVTFNSWFAYEAVESRSSAVSSELHT